ncbi:MAG: pilus assembly FimT family protein [Candidatus Acidiferrales bacterium]
MRKRTNSARGVSLVETLVVMAVAAAILAIATPSFLQAYRGYQVDNAASQVAAVLKATRFQAIRLNTPVNFVVRTAGGQTRIWGDSNVPVNDGNEQTSEPQTLLGGNVNLVAAGVVPNTAGLAAAIGVPVLTATSPVNGQDIFDGRGAANPAAPGVFVLYVGNTTIPAVGYRAVVLMPSGSIQVWSVDSTGAWRQPS